MARRCLPASLANAHTRCAHLMRTLARTHARALTGARSLTACCSVRRALQRKIMKRRCVWGVGLSIGFIVLLLGTIELAHYWLHWTTGSALPLTGAPPVRGAHMQGMSRDTSGDIPADMAALMDTSKSPCDNFYDYACGGFMENTQLNPDQTGFALAWDGVQHNNTERLLPYLAESKSAAGIFYESCMNLSAIEEVGVEPLAPFIKQVSEIKDLDSLEAVIYWWHKANVVVFYDWSVESNPDKPEESALYLMQGGITLPSTEFYVARSPAMLLKREGFRKVAREVLTEVCKIWKGCDVAHWPATAADQALRVETDLAERFASPSEQRTERAQQYTVDEISKLCPALHLKRFINAMAGTYHSQADTLVDHITIMIRNSPYFESLNKYMMKADLDSLKSYLLFRLAFVLGADMDAKMENMGFQLQRVVTGQVEGGGEREREEERERERERERQRERREKERRVEGD